MSLPYPVTQYEAGHLLVVFEPSDQQPARHHDLKADYGSQYKVEAAKIQMHNY